MKRVLFDSDVLLDVLAKRQPFVIASAQALNRVAQPHIQGYVSGHAVTNIFYLLRRQVGSEAARELLSRLLQRIQVASVTDEVIRVALQSAMTDFEDAVTSGAANAAGIEVIVTRNIADFVASPVPAALPESFLAMPLEFRWRVVVQAYGRIRGLLLYYNGVFCLEMFNDSGWHGRKVNL